MSKQEITGDDTMIIQQINFTKNFDKYGYTTVFFTLAEAKKKAILYFSKFVKKLQILQFFDLVSFIKSYTRRSNFDLVKFDLMYLENIYWYKFCGRITN